MKTKDTARAPILASLAVAVAGACLFACIRMPTIVEGPAAKSDKQGTFTPTYGQFQLKPDFSGPCTKADVVDVNIGNTPETFIQAAHCQVTGQAAPAPVVDLWAKRMRDEYYVRR